MIMVPRPLQFGVSGAAQEVPAGLCFQASEVVASFHIFLGHHLEVSAQGIYMGALGTVGGTVVHSRLPERFSPRLFVKDLLSLPVEHWM